MRNLMVLRIAHVILLLSAMFLTACDRGNSGAQQEQEESVTPAVVEGSEINVDAERIINADTEPGNWMSHGRTYDEQRYSPLARINSENVSGLGLAWYFDLDTNRGQEATPIVVDGVMYVSTAWSMVKALDAGTGTLKWSYDPEVPKSHGVYACCDVVNRGVAVWGNKVYFGTLDGRLIALNAVTGEPVWEVVTVDQSKPYTITGAPRIIKGKVIIGNGGAEYGVRGYVSAYDAQTGEMAWRFYTVPGDPSQPFEAPILEQAAQTWNGEWWKYGGGGTVWDSMAYDPELNLLYIGTGNGSPWNQSIRSPGGGDNLFLSSIVALDPDDGEYVWHYQTTPGETWDFTAAQHIILADLEIEGQQRKVLMQVPKNGFFYVIDRTNGEFISAEPVVAVTWATHIDSDTGRPVENPEARYNETGETTTVVPGPAGAHSWHPMSYNRETGLVYVPVNDAGFIYQAVQELEIQPHSFNTGIDFGAADLPPDPEIKKIILDSVKGHLAAWDPVTQKEVWRVQYPGPWNGGVLSTAGNLVIQGSAGGEIAIYAADNGNRLWSMPAQTGVVAAPVTYEVDGEQYIAVTAGWGGIWPMVTGELAFDSGEVRNISRIIALKLNGNAGLPAMSEQPARFLNPPDQTADAETIALGKKFYDRSCSTCHGGGVVSGNLVPDLRYSPSLGNELWFEIVFAGLYEEKGMVSYADTYSRDEIAAIQAYVIQQANAAQVE